MYKSYLNSIYVLLPNNLYHLHVEPQLFFERVDLSEREIELLRYLAANAGRAITRDELLAHVWRISPEGVSTRTIDMHVARLREKLRDDPAEPRIVMTVRGKGYMFGKPQNGSQHS